MITIGQIPMVNLEMREMLHHIFFYQDPGGLFGLAEPGKDQGESISQGLTPYTCRIRT